jgi:hypothetical protein
VAREPKPSTPSVATASWTGGNTWATRGATVGLWTVLLGWPVIAGLVIPEPGSASTAAPLPVSTVRDVSEQTAGAQASAYVAAWLSASKTDSAALQRYMSTSGMRLPDQGWAFRDLAVVSVGEATTAGLVPVQVAASVEETSIDTDVPVTSWQQRYFQVTVQVDGDAVGVVGMPTPVAGPAAPEDAARFGYGASVPSSSAAAATVSSFLAAYLTGNGELSRYTTPGVEFRPITPAPFSAVTVDDVTADTAPAEEPEDGDVLHLVVETTLVAATGQSLAADYALTMTARADRWEVTSLDSTPTEEITTH